LEITEVREVSKPPPPRREKPTKAVASAPKVPGLSAPSKTNNGNGTQNPEQVAKEPRAKPPKRLPEIPDELMPDKIEAYYDADTTNYFRRVGKDYIRINGGSLKMDLRVIDGLDGVSHGGHPSEADAEIVRIRAEQFIRFAGAVAGWDAGFCEMGGRPILVTESPRILQATYGNNMTFRNALDCLYGGEYQQALRVHLWIKQAREAFLRRDFRRLPAWATVGEGDLGKSFLKKRIATLLGGRTADPTQYLAGETAFNAHLFGAEFLFMDDPRYRNDFATRMQFGSALKQLIAGANPQCHAKGRTPFSVDPFWVVAITLNDGTDDLKILPPMDSQGMEDKVFLTKAVARAFHDDTTSNDQWAEFGEKIDASLSDYLGWLEKLKAPADLTGGRFGLVKFQHPDIMKELQRLSPSDRLWSLIDEYVRRDTEQHLTAREIEVYLKIEDSGSCREATDLLKGVGQCGKYLVELSKIKGSGITEFKRVPGGSRRFTIGPRSKVI
jgi:hypothetical protein